ncbi:MAG TPA: LysM peptidoglycan-binding domain-containing protein [Anaerolineae bacterium]|nr:LysM peptidoglycan-binding domain-containing protein [Anaerolineae bacterium]
MVVLSLLAVMVVQAATSSAQTSINLLQNPSFEDLYDAWGQYRELRTSAGWTPWWVEHEGDEGYILRRPECKSAHHFVFSNRVKSGEWAQQCFTSFGTHEMGLYQQVAVNSGQLLRFSIWVEVWSTSTGNPGVSELPGNVRVAVGIDPTGGADPHSPVIHWSPEIQAYDQWHFQFIEEVAQSDTVTVFTRSRAEFAVRNNDVYWDEAGLVDADLALSLKLTPIPTATRVPTPTPGPDSILYAPPVTDTVRVIAHRFGVDFSRVARANRVPSNVSVRPGLPVVVPGGHAQHAQRGTYLVQPGETLSSIAAKFQYRAVELAVLNRRYGPGLAWPGETLILP